MRWNRGLRTVGGPPVPRQAGVQQDCDRPHKIGPRSRGARRQGARLQELHGAYDLGVDVAAHPGGVTLHERVLHLLSQLRRDARRRQRSEAGRHSIDRPVTGERLSHDGLRRAHSRIQIAGPTGAFIAILAGVTAKFGVDGLLLTTMMAAAMLVLLGVARLGAVIRFIPDPVITGFTAGIATVIATLQLKDFLGLHIDGPLPDHYIDKVKVGTWLCVAAGDIIH